MNRSNCNQNRRLLGFEYLEAKRSPTASFIGVAWHDAPATAEVSVPNGQPAERFLHFVTMLEDISIERSVPSEAETVAVDAMIANTSPDSV